MRKPLLFQIPYSLVSARDGLFFIMYSKRITEWASSAKELRCFNTNSSLD